MFPFRDHNPSGTTPFVTYGLIAINVVAFLGYFALPEPQLIAFYQDWALVPAEISAGDELYTLVTCMFLHGGFMHIAGNMLFLYVFGDNLEDYFGHVGFLLFYLVSGFAASALQIATDADSTIFNIGASGAIAGVMGGYLLLFPRARVDTLVFFGIITVVTIPAFALLLVWFALQIFGGFSTIGAAGGGVAYWAHAGGFLAGAVLVGVALLGGRRPEAVDGHPDHPAPYPAARRIEGPWGRPRS